MISLRLENHVSFLREELKNVEISLFKILQKHGVKNAAELDLFFQKGKKDEAEGWEDFFELDGLEYKRNQIQEILKELES